MYTYEYLCINIFAHLRAHIVEGGEALERFRFCVESDDILHHIAVRMPVEVLQIVCRQNVDVAGARDSREKDDLVRVATLQQAFHPLDLVASLRGRYADYVDLSISIYLYLSIYLSIYV